jgi:glucose dehydrogenase
VFIGATPMSFQAADGRQFVVIAAGGSILLQSSIGDALVAFALAPK